MARLSIPKNNAAADDTVKPPQKAAPAKKKKPDADVLETAKARFQQAISAESENRKNYLTDLRFSSSEDQWDDDVKRLRGANRPALTFNRLNGVVKQIIGDYRQNKLALKVLPASGDASEDTADILAGIMRNIEAQSNADMAYVTALDCAARGGFGYFRVLSEYTGDDQFDQDLVIRPIHNPLTVYMDPSARLITREDANWAFITEMVPKDEFESLYPDADAAGFEGLGDQYQIDWNNGDQVRIAEYFEKVQYTARLAAFSNGIVMPIETDDEIHAMESIGLTVTREREAQRTKIVWRKMTAHEVLDTREYKIRFIPIVPVIGEEVNIEGKVFLRSAIFYAKDAQRMINYQKSTAVELAALSPKSPWVGTPKHFQGFEAQWDNANTTPTSRLTYNPDAQAPNGPQRNQPTPQPVAEIALAGEASRELQYTTGVFDASLGAPGQEVSGVAIGERQHQGATSTVLFTDNLKKSIEYCGRVLLDWIPITYDAERVVRVLDLEGNPQTETVNQQQYNPLTGVTEILNSITVGKYDVVIDTGPNFASRKRESLDAMIKLAGIYPQIMQLAGDLVVKQIDAPGMEQISDRIKRSIPPAITTDPESPEGQQMMQQQAQAAAQQKQQQDQLLQAHLQTEHGKQQAENAKSTASIAKAQAEVVKAKADTIQAVHQTHQQTMAHTAPAEAPAATGTASPAPVAAPPAQPAVTIQLNAEHAMGDVANGVHQMVAHSAASSHAIAATLAELSNALSEHGKLTLQQTHMLQQVMQHTAHSSQAVAHAVERGNRIAAAPRKAVRDPKTKQITGHEIVMPVEQPQGQTA